METAGIPWTMAIEAGPIDAPGTLFHREIGWVKITSMSIGRAGNHDFDRANNSKFAALGMVITSPAEDIVPSMGAIASEAQKCLEDYEETRRVRVLIDQFSTGKSVLVGGTRFKKTKRDTSRDDLRKLAIALDNLVDASGKTNPGPLIDNHLGISASTRKRLINEGVQRGLVVNRLARNLTNPRRSNMPLKRDTTTNNRKGVKAK
jgi:hypothetical protein